MLFNNCLHNFNLVHLLYWYSNALVDRYRITTPFYFLATHSFQILVSAFNCSITSMVCWLMNLLSYAPSNTCTLVNLDPSIPPLDNCATLKNLTLTSPVSITNLLLLNDTRSLLARSRHSSAACLRSLQITNLLSFILTTSQLYLYKKRTTDFSAILL